MVSNAEPVNQRYYGFVSLTVECDVVAVDTVVRLHHRPQTVGWCSVSTNMAVKTPATVKTVV